MYLFNLATDNSQGAAFSECRIYRYALWRIWDESKEPVAFVGLNPSTADETNNDPTVRRCINYAKDWGHGGLVMLNLFAFRATDPAEMKAAADPVGPDNDKWILHFHQLHRTVAAWGCHGQHIGRDSHVLRSVLTGRIECLGLTKGGHPKHPLYLRRDTKPIQLRRSCR